MSGARQQATRRPERAWAVVAGGGTAGHVLPGISIGEQIVDRGTPRRAVHYVGSARGVETRLVVEAGFSLTALGGRGIKRKLAVSNLAAAAGLAAAFARSLALLVRLRPAVVVGAGRLCVGGLRRGRGPTAGAAGDRGAERRAGTGQPGLGPVRVRSGHRLRGH